MDDGPEVVGLVARDRGGLLHLLLRISSVVESLELLGIARVLAVGVVLHWADRVAKDSLSVFNISFWLRGLEERTATLERVHGLVFDQMRSHEVVTELGVVIIDLVVAPLLH